MFIQLSYPTSYSRHMSCHGYDSIMSVLCTPLQVKCYQDVLLLFVASPPVCI